MQRIVRFYLRAGTMHQVQAPRAYEIGHALFRDTRFFYAFEDMKVYRKKLLADTSMLGIAEMGGGTSFAAVTKISVQKLARQSSLSPKQGEQIFRLVQLFNPQVIVELGTCLGVSTGYMLAAGEKSTVYSLEGNQDTATKAKAHLKSLWGDRVHIQVGKFENTLAPLLQTLERVDLFFIDGEHTEAGTLRNVELALQKAHDQTILIIADIHWSAGMERAWEQVRQHQRVRLAVESFHFGILVLDPGIRVSQYYCLRG